MFERMHEAPYTIELTDKTKLLDAALFYQESWADPNYTMSDWDDESVWAWGTRGMVNFGMMSLTSLNGSLAEDRLANDACSDASISFADGIAEREPSVNACSDYSSIHSLERVLTDEVTNGGLFIMVGSSTEDLSSAENGESLSSNQQHDPTNN
ncbi:uncharacterized protein ColSpa_04139 [Colletotrichum spaethianum]|uniref:Uncharacterized protein n=1 Tax=Colletotrichum spaethianum TaxID=700344 RepID=A0AA37P0S8_9PEZI|nr:uncharacterized protein ColSpa_04139 [Colletotrichum spaethianum]GKT43958.1 hypothetical protein ColSpa_04139 [Colletotrichum spaethianum]